MKTSLFPILSQLIFWVVLPSQLLNANSSIDSTAFVILEDLEQELALIHQSYQKEELLLQKLLLEVEQKIINPSAPLKARFDALLEKIRLQEQSALNEELNGLDLTKARYRKGIDLIRMLYEKILGLDHHFTSLETYQNIMQLSNPNNYPEFQQTKNLIERRLKKKNAILLPNLLQSNPFVSATFSLVASFIGEGEPARKEKDLEKISCILDFTLRMNADLNIIYYETEFLKESNRSLKEECIALFKDYIKVIGYSVPLNECRKNDDWEVVFDLLETFVDELKKNANSGGALEKRRVTKGHINLEFSVDRLLDFINKYNAFISQGGKYYQKFQVIVSNYKNESACAEKLPIQFNDLKKDISYSIEKFNEAYNIAELKGSKLKDLLYGFSD